MDSEKLIYCIGDSHASFFSGYDQIQPEYPGLSKNKFSFLRSFRLGAVLAYSLNKLNTKEKGREKLQELLLKLPPKATLLLCFGEIDCRCHILRIASQKKIPINAVINDTVFNYFQVVDELIQKEFNIIIWNVVPTSDSENEEYPFFGNHIERNKCTHQFNLTLKKESEKRNIIFISIFEKLLTPKFKTRKVFFFDSIHLGQLAMPYFLRELNKYNKSIKITNQYLFNSEVIRIISIILFEFRKSKDLLRKKFNLFRLIIFCLSFLYYHFLYFPIELKL